MKNKLIVPTSKERVMREDDFIVSKTDLTGRITYGNRVFIEYSGYTEAQLLGQQHNIIRHPDMPRSVFKLLWDNIAKKQEVFAYVKNMAKDGSFYWVFANITASLDARGNILGYYSVRRKPRESAIAIVTPLYQAMLAAEQRAGAKDAIAAGTQVLVDVLTEKGLSYEELVLAI
ncbi:PAS domain-containing protein [Rhodocyclus tenuis]|uniref:PAS domain-containing protein n=2 Tax=Rhodocyclus TaxID=1064 RepID=A0A6L5JY88_RHOTE|nr:PAS domain-containing protein [Rhodocyclus gracilis]MQY51802.1 PAS domain-containing protein [Rhodocyclus gracilis]NJA88381.1 PAS domain-containing protein [Rhodocyclus gracilis]